MRTSQKASSTLWVTMFLACCILMGYSITKDTHSEYRYASKEIDILLLGENRYVRHCKDLLTSHGAVPTYAKSEFIRSLNYFEEFPFSNTFKLHHFSFCPYPTKETDTKEFLSALRLGSGYPTVFLPNPELFERIYRYSKIISHAGRHSPLLKAAEVGNRKIKALAERISNGATLNSIYINIPTVGQDGKLDIDITAAQLTVVAGGWETTLDDSEMPLGVYLLTAKTFKSLRSWQSYFALRLEEIYGRNMKEESELFEALRRITPELGSGSLGETRGQLNRKLESIVETIDILGIKLAVAPFLIITFVAFPVAGFAITEGSLHHRTLPEWCIELDPKPRSFVIYISILVMPALTWILTGQRLLDTSYYLALFAIALAGIWIFSASCLDARRGFLLLNDGAGPREAAS